MATPSRAALTPVASRNSRRFGSTGLSPICNAAGGHPNPTEADAEDIAARQEYNSAIAFVCRVSGRHWATLEPSTASTGTAETNQEVGSTMLATDLLGLDYCLALRSMFPKVLPSPTQFCWAPVYSAHKNQLDGNLQLFISGAKRVANENPKAPQLPDDDEFSADALQPNPACMRAHVRAITWLYRLSREYPPNPDHSAEKLRSHYVGMMGLGPIRDYTAVPTFEARALADRRRVLDDAFLKVLSVVTSDPSGYDLSEVAKICQEAGEDPFAPKKAAPSAAGGKKSAGGDSLLNRLAGGGPSSRRGATQNSQSSGSSQSGPGGAMPPRRPPLAPSRR